MYIVTALGLSKKLEGQDLSSSILEVYEQF